MITIELLYSSKSVTEDCYTSLSVNNKQVLFRNKMLINGNKNLTSAEEKAAIWFVNSTLRIKSSVLFGESKN